MKTWQILNDKRTVCTVLVCFLAVPTSLFAADNCNQTISWPMLVGFVKAEGS